MSTEHDVKACNKWYNIEEMLEAVKDWCRHCLYFKHSPLEVPECQPHNMFILGGSGIGKTYCSTKAIKMMGGATMNIPVYYNLMRNTNQWNMMDDFMTRSLRPTDSARFAKCNYNRSKPLLIDDIKNFGKDSTFMAEKLYYWMEQLSGCWVIWTSNYDLDQIGEEFGQQVASRMLRHGNVVIEMNTDILDYNK